MYESSKIQSPSIIYFILNSENFLTVLILSKIFFSYAIRISLGICHTAFYGLYSANYLGRHKSLLTTRVKFFHDNLMLCMDFKWKIGHDQYFQCFFGYLNFNVLFINAYSTKSPVFSFKAVFCFRFLY